MRYLIVYELRRARLTFLTGNLETKKQAKRALKDYVKATWPKFGKPKILYVGVKY